MRPPVRKTKVVIKKPKVVKAPDASKELLKSRKWIRQAREEIRLARECLKKEWLSDWNEHLEWADNFLQNALGGK
jgi:hypothetical protein